MSTCEKVKHVLALCWELLSRKFAYELNMVDWGHFLLVCPFGNWELMKSFLSVCRETKVRLVDIISYLLPLWGYTPFRLVFSQSLKKLCNLWHNNERKNTSQAYITIIDQKRKKRTLQMHKYTWLVVLYSNMKANRAHMLPNTQPTFHQKKKISQQTNNTEFWKNKLPP